MNKKNIRSLSLLKSCNVADTADLFASVNIIGCIFLAHIVRTYKEAFRYLIDCMFLIYTG